MIAASEIVIVARQELQTAHEQLDAALQLLPQPDGNTSVASQELTQVLRRVKTAKHRLQTLEEILEPQPVQD